MAALTKLRAVQPYSVEDRGCLLGFVSETKNRNLLQWCGRVTMGRMHNRGKGICKLAKQGFAPSHRDSHEIDQANSITNNQIIGTLKLTPEIPEDLYFLIKKADSTHKHLEKNQKDKESKSRLIFVEHRINRLARYYKRTKKLPPTWEYKSKSATL